MQNLQIEWTLSNRPKASCCCKHSLHSQNLAEHIAVSEILRQMWKLCEGMMEEENTLKA